MKQLRSHQMMITLPIRDLADCLSSHHYGQMVSRYQQKALQQQDIGNDMLETRLEKYFVEQVEKHGGTAEKFVSPGRRFVPDRLVTWPPLGSPRIHFVELKTKGGVLSSGQARDHARRR